MQVGMRQSLKRPSIKAALTPRRPGSCSPFTNNALTAEKLQQLGESAGINLSPSQSVKARLQRIASRANDELEVLESQNIQVEVLEKHVPDRMDSLSKMLELNLITPHEFGQHAERMYFSAVRDDPMYFAKNSVAAPSEVVQERTYNTTTSNIPTSSEGTSRRNSVSPQVAKGLDVLEAEVMMHLPERIRSPSSAVDRLVELRSLHDKGSIDDEIYADHKAQVLEQL
jgi:hypothetical protein